MKAYLLEPETHARANAGESGYFKNTLSKQIIRKQVGSRFLEDFKAGELP